MRRVEIWFHNIDGHLYITGLPGTRGWYANIMTDPTFTFHLKESVQADIPARARPIVDQTERRDVLTRVIQKLGEGRDLEAWIKESPLIEVELDS